MKYYKTRCGMFFSTSGCGSSYCKGYSWGDDHCKEMTRCPFDDNTICTTKRVINSIYHNSECDYRLMGNCYGVEIDKSEFVYEKSIDKIKADYSRQSNKAVIDKFGCWCSALSADGHGGYELRRNVDNCSYCAYDKCIITKQDRDLTRVRVMADVEIIRPVEKGFASFTQKTLQRRFVTEPMAKDIAERMLRHSSQSMAISIFESNLESNTERANRFGENIQQNIIRYYIVPVRSKRNLAEDLMAVANGYTVQHEGDVIKAKKQIKSDRIAKRKDEKAKLKMRKLKDSQIEQLSLFD